MSLEPVLFPCPEINYSFGSIMPVILPFYIPSIIHPRPQNVKFTSRTQTRYGGGTYVEVWERGDDSSPQSPLESPFKKDYCRAYTLVWVGYVSEESSLLAYCFGRGRGSLCECTPECRNISEAINWTYGMSLGEIRDGKGVDVLGAT